MQRALLLFGLLTMAAFAQSDFDTIELADIEEDQLYIAGFSLTYAREIYVEAAGAGFNEDVDFDDRNINADPSGLYAYAWIINAETRKLEWRMTRNTSEHEGGDLYSYRGKIELPAGNYELYFYGRHRQQFTSKNFWNFGNMLKDYLTDQNNKEHKNRTWFVRLDGFDSSESEASVRKDTEALLSGASIRIAGDREYLFRKEAIEVQKAVTLDIYGIGEIDPRNEAFDYGWIKAIDSHKKIWEMKPGNGSHAGGALKNRVYRQVVELDPGVYEFAFVTDGSHQIGDWNSNPPFDPLFYGLTVFVPVDQRQFIQPYLANATQVLAEITRLGDDARRQGRFTLEQAARIRIEAIGEGDDGDMYDYGWLTDDRGRTIWEMNFFMTEWAGGAKKNRAASDILVLPKGDYTLHYRTDDSHSWEGWNAKPPSQSENYGIIASLIENVSEDEITSNDTPASDPDLLVEMTRVGNDAFLSETFSLSSERMVRIVAMGEGTRGQMYDYAWIESASARERVWEMRYAETIPAGGSRKNRLADTDLRLPAGEYRVYYQSDDSHAYGDWNARAPDNRQAWGIKIFLLP
jgi:hypothetical protein